MFKNSVLFTAQGNMLSNVQQRYSNVAIDKSRTQPNDIFIYIFYKFLAKITNIVHPAVSAANLSISIEHNKWSSIGITALLSSKI